MSNDPLFVKVEILEGEDDRYSTAISFTGGMPIDIVAALLLAAGQQLAEDAAAAKPQVKP